MNHDARQSQCDGKERLTPELARKIAKRLNGKAKVNAYRCEHCHHWHVGSHVAKSIGRGR